MFNHVLGRWGNMLPNGRDNRVQHPTRRGRCLCIQGRQLSRNCTSQVKTCPCSLPAYPVCVYEAKKHPVGAGVVESRRLLGF